MSRFNLWLGMGIAGGFLVGIPLHHFAHARLAMALGDKSARFSGRASLSIKRHIDPLGTLIVPGVWTVVWLFGSPFFPVFGWGKPQTLNQHLLRNPRRDVTLIALAGPGVLLLAAAAAGAAFSMIDSIAAQEALFAFAICLLNMAIIELLPIPGRDGGRVLAQFLSRRAQMKMYELAEYEVLFLVGVYLLLRGVVNSLTGFACQGVTPSIADAFPGVC